MAEFDGDRRDVVARAREAGVDDLLIVGGVDRENSHRRAVELARELGFAASAGIHPHEAQFATPGAYEDLRRLAQEGAIAAVGEVGLDFHYDHSPRPVQRQVLTMQVRLAREVARPLIIHTREADRETAEILEGEGAGEVGGVIHCFTGGPELAERSLALGFMISFSGILTFPRTEEIRATAKVVPGDRILVETDSPFLAPIPQRGRRNEPAFVTHVAACLAKLRGEEVDALGRQIAGNFQRLFGRQGPGREV
jgi:TatD DNase family protein